MSLPKLNKASLTVKNGRFRLVVVNEVVADPEGNVVKRKHIRYPQIQILKNRIRVGCITVSREAALKLIGFGSEGYVQGEATE